LNIRNTKKCFSARIFLKTQIMPLSLPMALPRDYILHVIPHIPNQERIRGYVPEDILRKIQKDLDQELGDNYKEHYTKKIGDTVRFEVATKSGREDEEILKFAKDEKVDIIVVGTHGKTGIEHVFFGSVAEKVLRHSPVPLFVIPCKKKLERL